MKIQHIGLVCLVSALCGGSTGLVGAKLFTGAEGRQAEMHCHLNKTGNTKFFCRNECGEDDVIIKTSGVRANSGRYSVTYRDASSQLGVLSMTFTNLSRADSGRYRCGFGKSTVPDTFSDFEIRVSHGEAGNAVIHKHDGFIQTNTEGENVTYPCHKAANRDGFFFCRDACTREEDVLIETDVLRAQSGRYSIEYKDSSALGLYVTITRVKKSDSGWYKCGYGRALASRTFTSIPIIVVEAPSPTKPNWTSEPPSTARTATTTSVAITPAATTETTADMAATTEMAASTATTAATAATADTATTATKADEATATTADTATATMAATADTAATTTAAATTDTATATAATMASTTAATATTADTAATTTATTADKSTAAATPPSRSSTRLSVSPGFSSSPAAAPATSKPNWTLQRFSTSASFSSGSSTPSSLLLPESTRRPTAAALATSPAAAATAQSSASTSRGSTASVLPKTTDESSPAGFVPAVCLPVGGALLLAAALLFRHMWKKNRQKQLDASV